ncbi:MAG: protein phosphatase 2C domain-containing protein [Opitutaceae bacterium]|nr:protein phosphatase 2C domain-containing protein [Opitutaceae bacterium]
MFITAAAQTDIGLVRSENEDRLLCADDLHLYAVADGIGGLPGGAEAAQTAITALLQAARKSANTAQPIDLPAALRAANEAVLDLGATLSPECGLGTTLCVATINGGQLHVANVGDSRCYLYREHRMLLLTTDDTVENEVLQRRARGERVQLEDRYRNALTRCIGQPMPLEVEVRVHPLKAGDQILVCSDGLSRVLDDGQLARRLGEDYPPSVVLGALVADALAKGGPDNITGVLIRIDAI